MNAVDIVILVLLGAFLLKGFWRGLLKELCSLMGLIGGTLLAFSFQQPLGNWLSAGFELPLTLCKIVAFVALFGATLILFGALGFVLSKFVKLVFLGGFNRVAGGVFGLVQAAVLLALLLFTLSLRPDMLPRPVSTNIARSELAPPFVNLGSAFFDQGKRMFQSRG